MKAQLLIDTASPCSSVALWSGGSVSSLSTDKKRQAAQQVLPLVDQILSKHRLSLDQLGALSVISGPGSFTGMRIGVAVAQGLASAANLSVLPVSTLAALAVSAAVNSEIRHWITAMHARDDEYYVAAYTVNSLGDAQVLIKEQIANASEIRVLVEAVPHGEPVGAVGNAFAADKLPQELFAALFGSWQPGLELNFEAVFSLIQARLAAGAARKPEHALPNYVKEKMEY